MGLTAEDKGKYQPWSHEEFMADYAVRAMKPTARKTYMMLLHEAFICETRPYLPADERKLKLMADCTNDKEWMSVRDTVLEMFEKTEVDGKPVLAQKRVLKDWARLQEYREKMSQQGKAGAAKRYGGPIAKPSPSMADDSKVSEVKRSVVKGREDKRSKVKRSKENESKERGEKGIVPLSLSPASSFQSKDAGHGDQDAEVERLCRDLTMMSGGKVAFTNKHRSRLAEVLKEFKASQMKVAFDRWLENQDLYDPKNVSFLAGTFVEAADALTYSQARYEEELSKIAAQRAISG